jgi:hypothetical protein
MDFFGESVYKCHDVLRPYFLPFIFFFFNSPDPPEINRPFLYTSAKGVEGGEFIYQKVRDFPFR